MPLASCTVESSHNVWFEISAPWRLLRGSLRLAGQCSTNTPADHPIMDHPFPKITSALGQWLSPQCKAKLEVCGAQLSAKYCSPRDAVIRGRKSPNKSSASGYLSNTTLTGLSTHRSIRESVPAARRFSVLCTSNFSVSSCHRG